jgi:hypothetical protein
MVAVVTHLLAFGIGVIVAGAYARRQIVQREALRRETEFWSRPAVESSPEETTRLWGLC